MPARARAWTASPPRVLPSLVCATALLAFALGQAGPARAAFGATETLSRAGLTGPVANGAATGPTLSGDGRVLAFSAWSSTLAHGGTLDRTQVYVRDGVTGGVRIASRADGVGGAVGDGVSRDAALSADGRFVAFVSDAANFVAGAPTGTSQVYVRDLVAGTIALVSRADGAGGAPAPGDAYAPSISADGRLVAFVAPAGLAGPAGQAAQVYVRDVVAGTTRLVSRAADGAPSAGDVSTPVIAGDGSTVAFAARGAANLAAGAPASRRGVFAASLATGAVELVSEGADGEAWAPAISADGQAVAFLSTALSLSTDTNAGTNAYLRDRGARTTALLSRLTGHRGDGLSSSTTWVGLSADASTALLALDGGAFARSDGRLVVRAPAPGQSRELDLPFFVDNLAVAADGRSAALDNRRQVLGVDLADDVPSVIEPPRVVAEGSGDPVVGTVLRCDPGRWTNDPSFRFAWTRDGDPIEAASGSGATYTVAVDDLGTFLRCEVTARNDAGARTEATDEIEVPPPADEGDLAARFAHPVFRARAGQVATLRLRVRWPGVVVVHVGGHGHVLATRRVAVRTLGPVAIGLRLPRTAVGWYGVTLRAASGGPVAATARVRVR